MSVGVWMEERNVVMSAGVWRDGGEEMLARVWLEGVGAVVLADL